VPGHTITLSPPRNFLYFEEAIDFGKFAGGMIWAIASYFNPMRYQRRLVNYRAFRSQLRIPLVAVELSFDGQFELAQGDADILVQISGGAVLWQKERLLDIAVK
jgi:hypothetical protein